MNSKNARSFSVYDLHKKNNLLREWNLHLI